MLKYENIILFAIIMFRCNYNNIIVFFKIIWPLGSQALNLLKYKIISICVAFCLKLVIRRKIYFKMLLKFVFYMKCCTATVHLKKTISKLSHQGGRSKLFVQVTKDSLPLQGRDDFEVAKDFQYLDKRLYS